MTAFNCLFIFRTHFVHDRCWCILRIIKHFYSHKSAQIFYNFNKIFFPKTYLIIASTATLLLLVCNCCWLAVCIVVVVLLCVVILCVFVVLCGHCCFYFTLDAGLLAISQYSEGPATGHLGTGFSWFPCA